MNTVLLFLALLVLLIACYAEDVRQHWSPDMMTPPGTCRGVICLNKGIHMLSAAISGSRQLYPVEPDCTLTALFDEQRNT